MGCGYAVCAMLGLTGAALIFAADSKWRQEKETEAWIVGTLGAALCLASVGLIAPMKREVARLQERRRLEEARPAEPWTWNPAWNGNKGIVESGRRHGRVMVFFGIAAILMSLPVVLVFPREIAQGNHAVWIALVIPLMGIGILMSAANDAWRRRKYGTARIVLPALPVPLASELAGMIIVDRPVIPLGAGRVSLECWCTTIKRHGGKRQRREEIVATTEREIAPADWQTSAGESQLFVRLPVRGGAATSMTPLTASSPVYEWRLRVTAPTAGADFVAEFVLPVFEITGAPASDSRGEATGTLTRMDRSEVWRAAGISEEPQSGATGGTALVFSGRLGRTMLAGPLTMVVIFGGLAAVLWWSPVPGIFAGFLGVFALLPLIIVKSLWSGGGERVWVESAEICVQRGTRRLRRLAARDVQSILSTRNVGVGAQQFYRVTARCPPRREGRFPRRVEIASLVRGDEAAGEVIAWLRERLPSSIV